LLGQWLSAFWRAQSLSNVVELEAAGGAPVNASAEPFLKVADRVLVHGVDMIDLAQLFHLEAPAAWATACCAKHEEKPLVERLS
jgi:hypothetical protein